MVRKCFITIFTIVSYPAHRTKSVIRQPSWTIASLFQRPTVAYVKKWLTRGHRAACDNQSRKSEPHKQECRYYHSIAR